MSTVVTRSLGKTDRYDRQSVRVDALAYEEKWGIFEITVTNYITVGSPAGGNVDIRVPNFNPGNDIVVVNARNVPSSPGTVSVSKKIYVAVNNGVVGPSARVNPDGTWDLLDLTYTLPENNTFTGVNITMTYTLAFTDLTASTTNPTVGNASITLTNSPDQSSDCAEIGVATSTVGASNGYVKAWINQITTTVTDQSLPFVPDLDPVGVHNDATPVITIGTGCPTCGQNLVMINHPLAKVSGTKIYSQGMLIFAINGGKIDSNGSNIKGTNGQVVAFKCLLQSDFTTDDNVSVDVSYNIGFQSM